MIKLIVAALFVGTIAGFINSNMIRLVENVWIADYLFNSALYALLFVMGLAFALDKEAIARFRRKGSRILIVPLAVALGSILGGLVAGLLLRLNVVASMAVTSGFGWYTLAGPLMGQMLGPEWGAMGFTVNFLRELFTLLAVSLLTRIDRYAPIASGGATAMDTTLSAIVRYSGQDALVTAFSSGFVLSLAAPFVITAIAALV
jgi:uncharacterized membrane protein YbjE (DUF340 family)